MAHRDCERCILKTKCACPYIFETPVPDGSRRMASLEHAPHPFVIEPPFDSRTQYAAGDVLVFVLVLVGRAIDYLPYFIFAFEQLGNDRGIGRAIEAIGDRDRDRATITNDEHDSRARLTTRGKFAEDAEVRRKATGTSHAMIRGCGSAMVMPVRPQSEGAKEPQMEKVTVTMDLPKSVCVAIGVRETDLACTIREVLAVELYRAGRLSLGKAADVAGVTRAEIPSLLAKHDVWLHYDVHDAAADRRTLRRVLPK